ncbi:ABC transporter ATP-binding protein [Schlesneria paludicola]|uniref:ABC transporter ATP-binding protein n=1 Tax=Schlesneria paludicola TaxID=360056 RepID=UPI00029AAE1A|nr:ABC transporter ATP-binding protein [Schlesneria paludicola]
MRKPEARSSWRELRMIVKRGYSVLRLINRRRKLALAGATLLMVATSAGNTGVALLLGGLIDRIQMGINEGLSRETLYLQAFWILGSISAIYFFREVINVYRRYLVESSCTSLNRDMQLRLVEHMLKTDLGALSQDKVGALHGKIFRSVDGLVRFTRLMFLDCLPALMTGLFALLAAVTKQPILGAVMLGVIPLAVWLTLMQLASQKGVRLDLMRDCEEIDGIVVEQLNGTEYIRVANTFHLEVERLSRATARRRKREVHHHFQMSLFGCAKSLNEGLFHVLVLSLATYLAVNQKISFGDILTFSVLFLNVMTPLNEIHRVVDEGHEASLRVRELLEMLHQPVDPVFMVDKNSIAALDRDKPAIVIEDLTLDYGTTDGRLKRGLNNVSLRIEPGQTIGVAGASGAGKSTWIKVLLRLVHPTAGQVWISGVSLEQFHCEDLARFVSYVGQNPFVFSGSIRENIAYGNGVVTEEQVRHAAQLAHLDEEIEQMPNGYDTLVLERGQNISGGQRQRLAIARVLLKNAPILILDEATSALDNISERAVQHSLGVTERSRTTIIIAHRLSTLKDCDRILVFDGGRIAEEGTYQELVEMGGLFAELVASGETHSSDVVVSAV